MIKKFSKSLAALALLFGLLNASGFALASGKMEVQLGQPVTLNVASTGNAGTTVKWVIKKGADIIDTQSSPIFNYTFKEQGEYAVNLVVTNQLNAIENTTVLILVGDRYQRPILNAAGMPVGAGAATGTGSSSGGAPGTNAFGMPSSSGFISAGSLGGLAGGASGASASAGPTLNLVTLPAAQPDGSIHLLGSGKVVFDFSASTGDFIEYRVDRNIFADGTDGNGVTNDDIDNAQSPSYLTGGTWQTEYKAGEAAKIAAEVTLVTKDGQKLKKQLQIVLDPLPQGVGDPVAVFDASPAPDAKDQLVHLYGDKGTVSFYAKKSGGKILEYRIDKNIFVDSDKDGNPANDIDNLNDISFKTGDVWQTTYDKTDSQIIAQLIVVGEGGKGSRVQRGIVFSGQKPPAVTAATTATATTPEIHLVADKAFVQKNDPITFTVAGLKQDLSSYTFAWDFDGNGVTDKEVEGANTIQEIYDTPGTYTAKVKITDKQGNSGDWSQDITVKDVVQTIADFDTAIDGNKVTFSNKSTAAYNLADKTLNYAWSFGDTDEANYAKQKDQAALESPVYTYLKAGKYVATLTVTDADQVTSTKSAEVVIAADLTQAAPAGENGTVTTPAAPETPATPAASGAKAPFSIGGLILRIFKIIGILIAIVIGLIALAVGAALIALKFKHRDQGFSELIETLKVTILTKLGVHEEFEHPAPSASGGQAAPEPEHEAAHEEEVAPPEKPVPASHLEGKEIMEAEVEEKKKPDDENPHDSLNPSAPPPPAEQGPVPDWLKKIQ